MRWILVLVAVFTASCSTAATIRKTDGSEWEVHIKRVDDTNVYAVPVGGKEEVTFARAEIADIDHPGNDHAAGGTIITALMMIPFVNVIQCTGASCDNWQLLIGGMTAIPLLWSVWGWWVWGSSRMAVSSSGPGPVETPAEPAGGDSRAFVINLFEWSW